MSGQAQNPPTSQIRTNLFRPASQGEDFPMEVLGIDTEVEPHALHGRRLTDGAEIWVALGPTPPVRPGYSRPEIIDLVSGDIPLREGGVVMVSGAIVDGDWHRARWLRVLSHAPGDAEVIIASAHFGGYALSQGSQEPFGKVEFLMDGSFKLSPDMQDAINYAEPFCVQSMSEMSERLITLLAAEYSVGIRLIVNDETGTKFDSIVLWNKEEDIERTVSEFMGLKLPPEIARLAEDSNNRVELIPVATRFIGKGGAASAYNEYQNELAKEHIGPVRRLTNLYNRVVDGPDGNARREPHYGKSVITLKWSKPEDGGQRYVFVHSIEPLFARNETFSSCRTAVCYASTKTFSPTPEYSVSVDRAQQSTQAEQGGPAANTPQRPPAPARSFSRTPTHSEQGTPSPGGGFRRGSKPTDRRAARPRTAP